MLPTVDTFTKAYDGRIVSARWKEGERMVLKLEPCGDEMSLRYRPDAWKQWKIGTVWGICQLCRDQGPPKEGD